MKPLAIFSSDNNPDYYQFAPIVTEFWEACGFDTFYGLVGSEEFPQVPNVSSSLQSQILRMYATKLFPDRVILLTDIDMLPLNKEYFLSRLVKEYDEISIYSSDAYIYDDFPIVGTRYPMCYFSSYGKTFSSVALNDEDETWEDFVIRLNSLNFGWNTDELYISEKINKSSFKKIHHVRGFHNPIYPGYDKPGQVIGRLDKHYWSVENINYVDAHCPRPYCKYKESIDSLKSFLTR
jgi:hypothetical protein